MPSEIGTTGNPEIAAPPVFRSRVKKLAHSETFSKCGPTLA